MNCLPRVTRSVYVLSTIPKHRHFGKVGSQLRSQFHRGFATHSSTAGVSLAGETRPVTKIEKIILDTIKANGPVSFSEYMSLCLAHPTEGYYTKPLRDILGARGDFVTSPEISQVFGELIAVWFLTRWLTNGTSSPFRIVELGPGKGTLMADILRAFSQFQAAKVAIQEIHLVETSHPLRSVQEQALKPFIDELGLKIQWHDNLDTITSTDKQYTMVLAHEFFDALPFHLIEKSQNGWREIKIDSVSIKPETTTILKPPGSTTTLHKQTKSNTPTANSNFRLVASQPSPSSSLLGLASPRFKDLPIGTRVEVSPASFKIAHRIGQLLSTKAESSGLGGAALMVDYGGDHLHGDSFRAFKNHKLVDVFHQPGECDLTANVDFAFLKEAVSDLLLTHGPISQADFLTRMGIDVRVEALKSQASTERADEIEKAAKRLTDLTGMGKQYKVLGFTSAAVPGEDNGPWPFVKLEEPTTLKKSA
ncbi:S-adenosyl-L-methionine-dependent methyltransferase [Thelephora terrestris]|uniref:Protein arginine methyltransferase NDUFAF7 n=1 Tax=Thelephora terrestris TaxID=56493 RepID=A0A9P6L956_9AGAM|nr:S-adenosyl-L-methionine-dependent methyltransferase [Thelephora terrestris]